jgi:hypothetical protein
MSRARARTPFWLARPTRFAALSRDQARIVLAIVMVLIGLAGVITAGAARGTGGAVASGDASDAAAYAAIVDGVRHGGDYYTVAVSVMRAGGYPLKPFVTVRLPTLAVVEAALPPALPPLLLLGLVIAAAIAWYMRLRQPVVGPGAPVAVVALLAVGLAVFLQPDMVAFHEFWAAPLIALSLALRRPGRWIEAVALGTIAMLIRETAAAYAIIMALLAMTERDWREAAAWAGGLALLAVALACHAHAVAMMVTPADPPSPGWQGLLGIGFVLRALAMTTLLVVLPPWLAAMLAVMAIAGWAAWDNPLGLRVLATIIGYAAVLGLFARADNLYWALLIAPVTMLGLLFAPDAMLDLVHRALDKRRITVTRISR